MENSSTTALNDLPATARMRSGTAARLAGVPVATLRVWERRYSVVAAPKTTTGQRAYSAHDVQRLRLLRQLTDNGHGIGRIATLDLPTLQSLVVDTQTAQLPGNVAGPTAAIGPLQTRSGPLRVHVVGRSAATRLARAAGCVVVSVHDDLPAALQLDPEFEVEPVGIAAPALGAAAGDVLLVQLASLTPAAAQAVYSLAARVGARVCLVLYAFGAEADAEALRQAGVRVRREPISGRELARWLGAECQTTVATAVDTKPSSARRFSDAELVSFAEQSTSVACECPRHLAEICMQLVGFEHYSADCGARSPADAALHAHLSAMAGTARAMFEQALERVALEEGLLAAPKG